MLVITLVLMGVYRLHNINGFDLIYVTIFSSYYDKRKT